MKKLISLFIILLSVSNLSAQEKGLDQTIDEAFQPISDFFSSVVFFEVMGYPFVILLLVGSALFFTLYFGFPNIRYFWTSINVVRGKYDEVEKSDSESEDGEVSHFQALATAVSGTVGNGNIAGVALAIALGGPGATFWMIICGLLGMSTKFVECTLGVHYRDVDEDGVVYGGPMNYISKGLKSKGFKTLGAIAASLFAVFCIGGSFGGGNAAQSNQATVVIKNIFGLETTGAGAIIGFLMAILVGLIIIGGIKRIASVTEKVVPFMAVLYLIACLYILTVNYDLIGEAISIIISEAFNPTSIGVGGIIGVLMVGFKRAAFSNEAGAGSASIAHSAVKTKYSASEGLVALLEPFIDTVVICTMTALVIITFKLDSKKFEFGDITKFENTEYVAEMEGDSTYTTQNFKDYEIFKEENGDKIEKENFNYIIDNYDLFVAQLDPKYVNIEKDENKLNLRSEDIDVSLASQFDTGSSDNLYFELRKEGLEESSLYLNNTLLTRENFPTIKYKNTKGKVLIDGKMEEGAGITQSAFANYIPFASIFLAIAVFLFAISTMISWSYYGLQSWKFLFGRSKAADITYKVLFLMFVVIGAAASMDSIWAFSDAMIFAMVFPNMVGLYFLFPIVKEQLKKYLEAIKN